MDFPTNRPHSGAWVRMTGCSGMCTAQPNAPRTAAHRGSVEESNSLLEPSGLCQDATDAPADAPDNTDPTDAPDGDPQTSIDITAPTDLPDVGDTDKTDGTSGTAAPDTTGDDAAAAPETGATAAPAAPDTDSTDPAPARGDGGEGSLDTNAPVTHPDIIVNSQINFIFPEDPKDTMATHAPSTVVTESAAPLVSVECVTEDVVKDRTMVKLELANALPCDTIKQALEEDFCRDRQVCEVLIAQEGEKLMLSGATIEENPAEASKMFQGGEIKNKLTVLKSEPVVKQGSAVLVSILVTGLLLAAGLIGGYVWLNNRKGNGKGVRLAEDSYPVDEENQGNTLVSVAPLNPPEPQEKPSLNGESPDGVKTQAPAATNGHSTAKTPVADTEL
ncbi:hematopoietic progenitor cell antigen CD34 [Sardina pilchardus]|uniref:hematopoietic progenitor cell antigen CD34 n=1 Tax=Sardina pilchardus TaxID=27697 RepID=UPI002E121214